MLYYSYGHAQKTMYALFIPRPPSTSNTFQFVHSATLAGHEDWVRSLAFRQPEVNDSPLVFASGSQDSTIRLWNIDHWKKEENSSKRDTPNEAIDELLDNFEATLGDIGENEEGGKQISLKHHIITVKTGTDRYPLSGHIFCIK